MDYKTEWERTIEEMKSEFVMNITNEYRKEEIMGEMLCPRCGQKFFQVEEGGPEWNVCRASDMKPFEKTTRLMGPRNDNGEHLIIDITLCDCGEPIHGFAIDEGWFHGSEEEFDNQDFLPSKQVWERECGIKLKPKPKLRIVK